MYSCIIVHDVFVIIRVKIQNALDLPVYVGISLLTFEEHQVTTSMPPEHVPYHDTQDLFLSARAFVDDLCQLKHNRVSVLQYIPSETTPITFLENCARTAVTSFRIRTHNSLTFQNLSYG
ncbi:hypothetical protein TNCV_4138141 [Trichonephila clavipes]|nr:hypothetical protein TNCV_4138141 [Trichonephila clavipes]